MKEREESKRMFSVETPIALLELTNVAPHTNFKSSGKLDVFSDLVIFNFDASSFHSSSSDDECFSARCLTILAPRSDGPSMVTSVPVATGVGGWLGVGMAIVGSGLSMETGR